MKRRRRRDYWPAEKLDDREAAHAAFIANLPEHMPPIPEWDNPALKRKASEYADAMALRRARLAGADTGRPVIRHEIIARDKSTCWICKRTLPENEIHLDHVIPISKGGKHDPENVKVACSSCNLWKGDRIVTVSLVR